jgi:hypothetical protein
MLLPRRFLHLQNGYRDGVDFVDATFSRTITRRFL